MGGIARAVGRTPRAARRAGRKWVVAVGDCGFDGGMFAGSCACAGGVSSAVPVDSHIRGCPPYPATLLDGLIARIEAAG